MATEKKQSAKKKISSPKGGCRTTNLEALNEEDFEKMLSAVNGKVLHIMEGAQAEANELLLRFGLSITVSADYHIAIKPTADKIKE